MPIDVSSSAALVASVQHSIQIVKAILGARDGALEREKTAELREKLFTVLGDAVSVQAALSSAQEEIRQLKERIVQFENWEAKAARYELRKIEQGCLVYAPKVMQNTAETDHYLCTHCFADRFESILQPETLAIGHAHVLFCPRCKTVLTVKGIRHPQEGHTRRR